MQAKTLKKFTVLYIAFTCQPIKTEDLVGGDAAGNLLVLLGLAQYGD